MRNVKFTTIILSLLFSLNFLCAQEFKKGYLIQHNGDSIFGEIKIQSVGLNANECVFRRSENSPTETYLPQQIRGYRYSDNGRFYVSREIELDSVKHLVFLEYLLEGRISLYYYKFMGEHYFFETVEGRMVEIVKRDEIIGATVEDQKGLFLRNDNRYIGVLSYLFRDCPSLSDDIPSVSITHNDLIKITKRYHDLTCEDGKSCVIFETQKGKVKINIFFQMALLTTNLSIFDYTIDYGNKVFPFYELGVQITLPHINPNVRLCTSLGYERVNFKSEEYFFTYSWKENRTEGEIMNLKLGVNYIYPSKKIRPFGGLGASILRFRQTDGESREEVLNSISMFQSTKFKPFNGDKLGVYGTLGFEIPIFKKISILASVNSTLYQSDVLSGVSLGLKF